MAQVFSPTDAGLGWVEGLYSPGLAQQMVWLSGLLTFGQCVEVLGRIGGCQVSCSSLWRRVQRDGARLVARLQSQQAQVRPERLQLEAASADHAVVKGVSMDGGMLNIRGEGWKEVKVGAVYDVTLELEKDERSGEYVDMAHAQNTTYTAVLGHVAAFVPALWALAVRHKVPTARQSSVTADGAEWIWNVSADLFPDSSQIVDWYPAADHLAQAATALYPDDPQSALQWLHQRQDDLFLGQIHAITAPLDKAYLTEQSHYFHSHQRRMQYHEFRENGFPIGSGSVESGVKQFKTRLTAAGMRWNRPGAQRMLVIRGAVLDHSFDTLWAAA